MWPWAWYDYYFNCDIVPLKKGSSTTLTGLLKPPVHENNKQMEHKETIIDYRTRMGLINVMHLLFIVPLLLYIVVYKNRVNTKIYPILGALAMFTAAYHGIGLMGAVH